MAIRECNSIYNGIEYHYIAAWTQTNTHLDIDTHSDTDTHHTHIHNTPAHSDGMLSTPDILDVQLITIANTMACAVPAPL